MGVRIVMPLRVLLPCLAVCLAAAGAAAIGVAEASTAGGFVMRQADDAVRACASGMLSHGVVTVPGSGLVPGPAGSGTCGMELVSASGQVLIPAAPAAGGPAIPASGSWLAAHLAEPVTASGARGGGRWQVVITAVHYQAQRMLFVDGPDDLRYVISGRTDHGSSGMLIVTVGLAGTGQVAADYAAAAGTVLILLAAAAFALTRAILRPLRAAAGLTANAGQGAGGRLEEVLARVGMPANGPHGRYGMMLTSSSGPASSPASPGLRPCRRAHSSAHSPAPPEHPDMRALSRVSPASARSRAARPPGLCDRCACSAHAVRVARVQTPGVRSG